MSEIERWLRERAVAHGMTVEQIDAAECRRWQRDGRGTSRDDRRFMEQVHLRVRTSGREVAEWDQIALYEIDAPGTLGTVVLVEHRGRFLVRAIAEPCNIGVELAGTPTHTLFGPTIQYSGHNRIAHAEDGLDDLGGKASPTPLIGFFEDPGVAKSVRWQRAAGSGGRHRQVVQIGHLEIYEGEPLRLAALEEAVRTHKDGDDFRWVSRDELVEIYRDGLSNHHLRSAASLLL